MPEIGTDINPQIGLEPQIGLDHTPLPPSIERCFQRATVQLPRNDYISRMRNGVKKHEMIWVYDTIAHQLPADEVGKAWGLAQAESLARIEKRIRLFQKGRTQIAESKQFAFRTFKRRSDGGLIKNDPRTALSLLPSELHESGIDSAGASNMIYPGLLWYENTFPVGLEVEHGIDTVEVLVYNNRPYIVPSLDDPTTVRLVHLDNDKNYGDMKTIPLAEAQKEQYPTLRELLIGQIEIDIS